MINGHKSLGFQICFSFMFDGCHCTAHSGQPAIIIIYYHYHQYFFQIQIAPMANWKHGLCDCCNPCNMMCKPWSSKLHFSSSQSLSLKSLEIISTENPHTSSIHLQLWQWHLLHHQWFIISAIIVITAGCYAIYCSHCAIYDMAEELEPGSGVELLIL